MYFSLIFGQSFVFSAKKSQSFLSEAYSPYYHAVIPIPWQIFPFAISQNHIENTSLNRKAVINAIVLRAISEKTFFSVREDFAKFQLNMTSFQAESNPFENTYNVFLGSSCLEWGILHNVSEAPCIGNPPIPDPCCPPWRISLWFICPWHNIMPATVPMFSLLKPSFNFQVNTQQKCWSLANITLYKCQSTLTLCDLISKSILSHWHVWSTQV